MSVDLVLRAITTLSCLYSAGLFITLTSIAALNAVTAGTDCAPVGCHVAAYEQAAPGFGPITPTRSS